MRERLAALFFTWDIKIDANTEEAEPETKILKLTKGVITGIDVKYPAGCHGMVKVRLRKDESQLVPLSRGEWLTGDDETIPTEAYYELDKAPYQLKFIGCSPDTSYDHTMTVRVQMQSTEVAAPYKILKDFTDLMKRVMGL